MLFAFLVPKNPFFSGEAHYIRGWGRTTLHVRPKPEQQKLLDQLLPQQGIRYKTQGLFFKEKRKSPPPTSHIIFQEDLVTEMSLCAGHGPPGHGPPFGPGGV